MRGYLAYLLRLWHIKGAGKLGWRASLEDSHSGERLGFPNVEALIDYLTQVIMNRGYTTDHENVIQLLSAANLKVAGNWCPEPEPKSDLDV